MLLPLEGKKDIRETSLFVHIVHSPCVAFWPISPKDEAFGRLNAVVELGWTEEVKGAITRIGIYGIW